MSTPTITIALKRAADIVPTDVIRFPPNEREWRFVYNVARGAAGHEADTDEAIEVVDNELDERYVLLRIAVDPPMRIDNSTSRDRKLHSWVTGRETTRCGVPAEREDRYVVLREYDLVEVQTLVQTEPPKIEVLHEREPDSGCTIRVWVDGVETPDAWCADLDPLRGWVVDDWDRAHREAIAHPDLSESYRAALDRAYTDWRNSKYVVEDER